MLAALARQAAPCGCTGLARAAAIKWWRWLPAETFSSTTTAATAPAATPAAAAPDCWHQRFAVAPGSTLRLDLPHTAADVSIRVGEHEAIELSASTSASTSATPDDGGGGSEGAQPHTLLAAAAAVDPRREGSTIGGMGGCSDMSRALVRAAAAWVPWVVQHAQAVSLPLPPAHHQVDPRAPFTTNSFVHAFAP